MVRGQAHIRHATSVLPDMVSILPPRSQEHDPSEDDIGAGKAERPTSEYDARYGKRRSGHRTVVEAAYKARKYSKRRRVMKRRTWRYSRVVCRAAGRCSRNTHSGEYDSTQRSSSRSRHAVRMADLIVMKIDVRLKMETKSGPSMGSKQLSQAQITRSHQAGTRSRQREAGARPEPLACIRRETAERGWDGRAGFNRSSAPGAPGDAVAALACWSAWSPKRDAQHAAGALEARHRPRGGARRRSHGMGRGGDRTLASAEEIPKGHSRCCL